MTLFKFCMRVLLQTLSFRAYLAYECLMLQLQTAREEF